MTKQHRLFQVDTYKAANGVFKELLEQKLSEITTHPEWWTTRTEEWEGAYNDFGPPVHTWILSDRSEEEVLAIARTVCPYAEIGHVSDFVKSDSDLVGLLCAVRPERYANFQVTEKELQSRLGIDDWAYYVSYSSKSVSPTSLFFG
jgi:hypothetical protein